MLVESVLDVVDGIFGIFQAPRFGRVLGASGNVIIVGRLVAGLVRRLVRPRCKCECQKRCEYLKNKADTVCKLSVKYIFFFATDQRESLSHCFSFLCSSCWAVVIAVVSATVERLVLCHFSGFVQFYTRSGWTSARLAKLSTLFLFRCYGLHTHH